MCWVLVPGHSGHCPLHGPPSTRQSPPHSHIVQRRASGQVLAGQRRTTAPSRPVQCSAAHTPSHAAVAKALTHGLSAPLKKTLRPAIERMPELAERGTEALVDTAEALEHHFDFGRYGRLPRICAERPQILQLPPDVVAQRRDAIRRTFDPDGAKPAAVRSLVHNCPALVLWAPADLAAWVEALCALLPPLGPADAAKILKAAPGVIECSIDELQARVDALTRCLELESAPEDGGGGGAGGGAGGQRVWERQGLSVGKRARARYYPAKVVSWHPKVFLLSPAEVERRAEGLIEGLSELGATREKVRRIIRRTPKLLVSMDSDTRVANVRRIVRVLGDRERFGDAYWTPALVLETFLVTGSLLEFPPDEIERLWVEVVDVASRRDDWREELAAMLRVARDTGGARYATSLGGALTKFEKRRGLLLCVVGEDLTTKCGINTLMNKGLPQLANLLRVPEGELEELMEAYNDQYAVAQALTLAEEVHVFRR
ncbi:unnamed protein product [Pedinophyceae sp. YPF-701]|nr:unnamed protein product [Pedinophyceae sp. YPF-701]